MRRLCITFAISLLVTPAIGNDLRAVTHEDVWLMKRLGTPVISPDGRQAVVSVTVPSYEEDGARSDLWLVDVGGDVPPRQLTATKESESDVDWSPDGSRIAFSTKRGDDEVNQIYVLNMVGPGEAFPITSLSTGAGKPKWSPDGNRIAFESRVYPGLATDEENAAEKKARDERGYNASVYETFPIRQWDTWRDDLQTHLFVQDAEAGAEPRDLLAGSALVAAPGFRGVESRSTDSLAAVWAPDGAALVISATTQLDTAAHARVRWHLYKVSVDGGVEQLTESDDWSCTNALFSDDGDALYCQIRPANEHVYNLTDIGRFGWTGGDVSGDPDIITTTFDRPITGMDLTSNGRTVYATAFDAGRSRLYAIPARGGNAEMLDEDGRGAYAGVQAAGRQIIARWESSETPAEIVRIASNGEHVPITAFNAERAAGLDRKPFREFWFESSKGRRIHNWLALPPGFDETRKYPLVLLIHGGPFATTLDADHVRWSPHLVAAPGYVVLMTDYTGSVGYGEQFSRNIQGDPLRTPGEELVEAADAAIERYPFIDGDRQAAAGASYGGHLVNWLQASTTRFDALVGHAGLIDLEGQYSSSDTIYGREIMNGGPAWENNPVWSEQSPASYADRFRTPILLTIGEKDYRVPINQTIAAWSYVQRNQVPGRLLVFHDANHWIMKGAEARYYWQEVHDWLAKYLSP